MNNRECLKRLHNLGASISQVRRKGELRIKHPAYPRPVIINQRRKDAGRQLMLMLKRVEEASRA